MKLIFVSKNKILFKRQVKIIIDEKEVETEYVPYEVKDKTIEFNDDLEIDVEMGANSKMIIQGNEKKVEFVKKYGKRYTVKENGLVSPFEETEYIFEDETSSKKRKLEDGTLSVMLTFID